jgi:cytochrome c
MVSLAPLAASGPAGAQQGSISAPAGTPVSQPKGDAAFGEYLSSLCVTCHLPSGRAVGGIPPIVAWPEDQFIAVINSYRWKDRDNEVMRTVTAQLTDEEIAALAAYFGGLTIQPDVK